jgi:aspartyl-tRNA synthetase
VRLGGWVHRRRDLGGLVFIDLRDRAGLVQLSCNPAWTPPDVMERAAGLGAETVVLARGTVELRPEPSRDPSLVSREVELHVTGLEVVGPAQTPPIPVARKEKEEPPAEELRLRHRVLDLRRPELQRNLILRHRLMQATRRYFDQLGFLEIETPILTKPTPEGARDYLVPSRVHPGEFFPSRLSSTSSSSWSPGWTATSRSPAASATRTSGPTASRSSPRSTSRPRSSVWRTCSASARG